MSHDDYPTFCASCHEPRNSAELAAGKCPDCHSAAVTKYLKWANQCPSGQTVKRATLFDGVLDTYQTETELNGFRETQGALL